MADKKLNSREQKFCELVAVHPDTPPGRLYEQAGYKSTGSTADVCACQLLKKPKVSQFIESLRWEAGTTAAQTREKTILSITERREFLARVVRTAPGEIDEDSPLCQSYKNTPETREIKMPDKLRAVELDSKLAGDFKDTIKLEAGDKLLALLGRIRSRA